jgi:transposase-like protein
MRKTIKHKIFTIEEKNKIVEEYLCGKTGRYHLIRKYGISSSSMLHRWIVQYREFGTVKDNRGNSGKNNPNFGKHPRKKLIPEQMTHNELIQYVKATEDIKKLMVYLRQQKKNIK